MLKLRAASSNCLRMKDWFACRIKICMSFFADVPKAPPDPLLSITGRFKADSRPNKFDLGIGVLRRTDNTSHEFETVKVAAKSVAPSCFYPHPGGDDKFVSLMAEVIFGSSLPPRVMGVQTVGGSGALRVCAELLVSQGITTMMLPDPSWANHKPLLGGGGLKITEYRYFKQDTHTVDIDSMLADIQACPPKTAIMFQVAAHNPTGVDITDEQWDKILELMKSRRDLFPVFDSAYQGLARGLNEDIQIVRKFLDAGLEFAVCSSCSKNFGLYGERVGSFFVACETPEIASCVDSRCKLKIRHNYSVPPLFGAKIVSTILSDPELRKKWEQELAETRTTLNRAHAAFAQALSKGGLDSKFSAPRFGLFTQLYLNEQQVLSLEKDHACYVAPGGRVNVSSLDEQAAASVANAVVQVLKST